MCLACAQTFNRFGGAILPPENKCTLCYREIPTNEDIKKEKSIHFNDYDGSNYLKVKFSRKLISNLRSRNLGTTRSLN